MEYTAHFMICKEGLGVYGGGKEYICTKDNIKSSDLEHAVLEATKKLGELKKTYPYYKISLSWIIPRH